MNVAKLASAATCCLVSTVALAQSPFGALYSSPFGELYFRGAINPDEATRTVALAPVALPLRAAIAPDGLRAPASSLPPARREDAPGPVAALVPTPPLNRARTAIIPATPPAPVGRSERRDLAVRSGLASWYGGGEKLSRHTANGEVFNPDGLTAAHRTLPLGTKVLVSANGRSVVVRINDRGPALWTGREIDLSKGAAKALGFISKGTTKVSWRVAGG